EGIRARSGVQVGRVIAARAGDGANLGKAERQVQVAAVVGRQEIVRGGAAEQVVAGRVVQEGGVLTAGGRTAARLGEAGRQVKEAVTRQVAEGGVAHEQVIARRIEQ